MATSENLCCICGIKSKKKKDELRKLVNDESKFNRFPSTLSSTTVTAFLNLMICSVNYKLIHERYPQINLSNCYYHKSCINALYRSSQNLNANVTIESRATSIWQSDAFDKFCLEII